MQIQVIFKNARCAALELKDGSIYEFEQPWELYLNGDYYKRTSHVVTMLYGLIPETKYELVAKRGEEIVTAEFVTNYEYVTLNVRNFGAKGDGISDDTHFIQAAIMACPQDSRVLIPQGQYRITSLFLKDNLNLEIEEGAVLKAFTERERFSIYDGIIPGNRANEEYLLGTWAGEAMNMFTGIICGIGVKNVTVYGEGIIDGNADWDNWWERAKEIRIAARPRVVFLNKCQNINMLGLTVQNSPSWNVHPYFSDHLRFICMKILGPKVSPNTDGLDPDSCSDVEITGLFISVGDDCIALKSGMYDIGSRYRTPSKDILIRQCCMQDGHGAVVLGSDNAGGLYNIRATECLFLNTDRGLRIKTRRGRGKDAIIDDILFQDIYMNHVKTPFSLNCFYFCDDDGHSHYVQYKGELPVDERTPDIRNLTFKNIKAENCHVAAAYYHGLPEKRVGQISMENIRIDFAEDAVPGLPIMTDGLRDSISRMGLYANNIEHLLLKNVSISGCVGEAEIIENVGNIKRQ